jgi:hypothetical protein
MSEAEAALGMTPLCNGCREPSGDLQFCESTDSETGYHDGAARRGTPKEPL